MSLQAEICTVLEKYDKCGEEFDAVIDSVNEELMLESMDEIAPQDRQSSEEAIIEREDSTSFSNLQPPTEDLATYGIGPEIGITSEDISSAQRVIPNRLSNDEFYVLMRTLNMEQ